MDPNEQLGKDTLAAMRALSAKSSPVVVSSLYGALYELALRSGQTPRTVLEVFFREAPGDDEWREKLLPFWRALLDRSGEAAA